MIKRQLFPLIVLPALLGSAAAEAPQNPRAIADFMSASDLVFHGTVVDIEYIASEPVRGEPDGIPHTFVTYRIENVLHGSADGEEITLRFLGGLEADGTYFAVNVTPQFDLGDEDVLFVRGNGDSGCPLVADYRGRLRLIDDQVYTDTGRSLTLDANGSLLPGERYNLTDVATTIVNGEVLVTAHDPEALDGPSDAMRREALMHFLAVAAAVMPAPEAEFESANPAIPFVVPPFTPVELRDSKSGQRRSAGNEVADSAEPR